jgi:hypothetical protein
MKLELLTLANSKTQKSEFFGWLVATLQLLPNYSSGKWNVCPFASVECILACNAFSGVAARMPSQARKIYLAKLVRTELVMEHRSIAEWKIEQDIKVLLSKCEKTGQKLAVRLNCFSDLNWLEFIAHMNKLYPSVTFYDYTKGMVYLEQKGNINYHLTFSWSGKNKEKCLKALSLGYNVAVPFQGKLPATFLGYPVIDGDQHDLRFLDPVGCIVGLKVKKSKPMFQHNGEIIQQSMNTTGDFIVK